MSYPGLSNKHVIRHPKIFKPKRAPIKLHIVRSGDTTDGVAAAKRIASENGHCLIIRVEQFYVDSARREQHVNGLDQIAYMSMLCRAVKELMIEKRPCVVSAGFHTVDALGPFIDFCKKNTIGFTVYRPAAEEDQFEDFEGELHLT